MKKLPIGRETASFRNSKTDDIDMPKPSQAKPPKRSSSLATVPFCRTKCFTALELELFFSAY